MYAANGIYIVILVALVVVALVAVIVALSIRASSGVALVLLLGAVTVVYVAGIASNAALFADPADYVHSHPFAGLGSGLATLVDLFLFALSGLATLIVVAVARRWIWLAAVVVSLLPLAALTLVGLLPWDPLTYASNVVPFTGALFFPVLVGLIYALSPHHRQRRDWDAYAAWPPRDIAP